VSAECHRARVCGREEANCTGAAAARHATLDLAHCPDGVNATRLSVCADLLRNAVCELRDVDSASCKVASLCGQ
jgi:hypothetical protein